MNLGEGEIAILEDKMTKDENTVPYKTKNIFKQTDMTHL